MAEPEESIPSVLLPCNSCGRTFRPDALTKHAKYCEKSLIKKRKVFDSAKQRLQGDLAECLPVLATQKKKPDKSPIGKTQSKWKEKHLEFVRAIRAAKGESEGGSVPAPPSKPVDHEKCLYCDRYFGPKAYDRHLEWCKEHSSLVRPKSPASIQAKQRLEARTKYKAPLLNRTRRASISEKCSPKSCTRDPSPAADRLTRTRSSSLSSRTVTSMNREPLSNVSPKNNAVAVVDSFRRNQPARNSRRSVSPLKRTTPETSKNKTVNNNLNQNNRTRGRQLASYEMKNEAKSTPKSAKDDMFSASCNISPITPGQNQKLKTRTPSHNSMENYDPYKSAERQMKELLGLSDDDDAPLVHSLVPQPPPHSSSASLLNSFHSAFAKFSPIHSHRDASDHPSPDSDLDNNDFERLEAESRVVTPGGIVDKNFNPMSLSTISLCSTISIESFDNSRNNLRKGVSLSAKVQSGDRKASLPLQRSVSVVEAPRRGKSNLKMEDLLFGNNYNNNNLSFNNDDVDNKSLKSSNELLKTSNFGDSFHDIDNKPLKSSNELLKTSNYGDSLYDIDNKPRRSSNESSKTSNYVDSLHDNDNKPRRPSNELLKNSNYVDSLHDNDNKPRRPSNESLKNSNYGDSLHDIDNKQLRSSNKLLKTSNSSLEDASRAEQELLKSVSEFEKLFAAPASSLNPYSPLMPNSSPASNLAPLESIDKHRSQAGKFIIDSAYNSLNRKSPQEGSPVDLDNCSSGSECSSTRGKAAQTANFCHECGAKFPVLAAKFCCNCGVRRLVI